MMENNIERIVIKAKTNAMTMELGPRVFGSPATLENHGNDKRIMGMINMI